MKDNIKKNLIIKFITFLFFIWIYQKYDDEVSFSKGLENICNRKDSIYIEAYRLLAKQDLKTGLYDKKLEDNLLNYRDNEILKMDNYGSSVYKKLQKSCSNDLKIYKQQFKRKYAKTKGLKRLDCYCEKKIFDMIEKIGEQPVGTSSNNIKLKKNIVRKWGIRFIVMCLIPLIGIILPILDQIDASSTILFSKQIWIILIHKIVIHNIEHLTWVFLATLILQDMLYGTFYLEFIINFLFIIIMYMLYFYTNSCYDSK
ncbi:hypothetical protein PVBG_05707 [Plasmodium vivax Brazil I]|uniref:Variable surface protein n=1 Tax=Plasmodium vivax (strain Brazil I) TaxID=1033975 RepID=A0A0J9T075_PLAV1|nr:hypothetical protein PVBG_05707 [Plasmodium vivax Brazil I]